MFDGRGSVPNIVCPIHRWTYDLSGKLLGVRYQANTLIGSPTHPEEFVVRDDAFDCVTFCEVVLAAAIARDLSEFETSLRRIRYDHGKVQYDQRNHCRRA